MPEPYGILVGALRTKTHLSSGEWWYSLPSVLGWRFLILIQNMRKDGVRPEQENSFRNERITNTRKVI